MFRPNPINFRPAAAAFLISVAGAAAQSESFPAYYFPEKETCTALIDFQKIRDDLQKLQSNERSQAIARDLLREFAENGATKCAGATQARLMAIYIPGTDNYGRPDFPNRINVLRLDGTTADLVGAARREFKDVNQLAPSVTITTFE